jgi:hypothetical protein
VAHHHLSSLIRFGAGRCNSLRPSSRGLSATFRPHDFFQWESSVSAGKLDRGGGCRRPAGHGRDLHSRFGIVGAGIAAASRVGTQGVDVQRDGVLAGRRGWKGFRLRDCGELRGDERHETERPDREPHPHRRRGRLLADRRRRRGVLLRRRPVPRIERSEARYRPGGRRSLGPEPAGAWHRRHRPCWSDRSDGRSRARRSGRSRGRHGSDWCDRSYGPARSEGRYG